VVIWLSASLPQSDQDDKTMMLDTSNILTTKHVCRPCGAVALRRHTVLLLICAALLSACSQFGDQRPQSAPTAPAEPAASTTAIFKATVAAPTTTPAAVGATPAQRYDAALRDELLRMEDEDQELRGQLAVSLEATGVMSPAFVARIQAVDAEHTARMKAIIAEHGWPGVRLVRRDGAEAAWLLVQHADQDVAFQRQCLALLEAAAARGEVPKSNVAYLTDRVLTNEGKEQLYGTQSWNEGGVEYLQPLQDPEHVNERRRAVGLGPLPEPLKIKPLPDAPMPV
jgi:hypothetical protein